MDYKAHVQRAVKVVGSQQKLADAMGCTQQQISYLLTSANRITGEMALRIERATAGAVTLQDLRPDLAPATMAEATS